MTVDRPVSNVFNQSPPPPKRKHAGAAFSISLIVLLAVLAVLLFLVARSAGIDDGRPDDGACLRIGTDGNSSIWRCTGDESP